MSGVAARRPPRARVSRELLRDSILDAVGELLASGPWDEVRMADVATVAGVSRQTLYNVFGGRSELANAYLMRESDRFLSAVEEAIAAHADDPHAALREALERFLTIIAEHPLAAAVRSEEGDEVAAMVTSRGGGLLAYVSGRIAAALSSSWPELSPADARLTAETLARLGISHAALPVGDPAETAAALTRILGPSVDALLGSPGTGRGAGG